MWRLPTPCVRTCPSCASRVPSTTPPDIAGTGDAALWLRQHERLDQRRRPALVRLGRVVATVADLTLVAALAGLVPRRTGTALGRPRAREQDQHQAAGVFATRHVVSVSPRPGRCLPGARTEGVTRE